MAGEEEEARWGSLMGPSANSNERGAISAPSFRKSLLALPLRQLCPAESLNPRPRSTSCPRSGSVARRIKVENRRGGGERVRGQGIVHATFLEKKEFNSKSTVGTGSPPRGGSRRTPCQKVSEGGFRPPPPLLLPCVLPPHILRPEHVAISDILKSGKNGSSRPFSSSAK